jgi:hypothetical protein
MLTPICAAQNEMKTMTLIKPVDPFELTDADIRSIYACGYRIAGNGDSEIHIVQGDYIAPGWTEIHPSGLENATIMVPDKAIALSAALTASDFASPNPPEMKTEEPPPGPLVTLGLPQPVLGVRAFPNGSGTAGLSSVVWFDGSLTVCDGRRRWKCAYCEFDL